MIGPRPTEGRVDRSYRSDGVPGYGRSGYPDITPIIPTVRLESGVTTSIEVYIWFEFELGLVLVHHSR